MAAEDAHDMEPAVEANSDDEVGGADVQPALLEDPMVKAMIEMMGEGFQNDEGFVLTDAMDDVLINGKTDTFYIDTGRIVDGKPQKMPVTIRDTGDPDLAYSFLRSQESEEAYVDLCRLLVVEPRWLVEDHPVKDSEGNFIDEDGRIVEDEADAARKAGVLLTRSAFQVNLKHRLTKVCGVVGDFFESYSNDLARDLRKLVKQQNIALPGRSESGQSQTSKGDSSNPDTPKQSTSPNSTSQTTTPSSIKPRASSAYSRLSPNHPKARPIRSMK